MRVDQYLVAFGYAESRQKASLYIKNGSVIIDHKRVLKPAEEINEKDDHKVEITLTEEYCYVSRGALKLKAAIEKFNIDVNRSVCVDIGASTGGFTDYLLQRGALKVYAFDSGKGQLHPKLAGDPRVISKEGFNARFITPEDVSEPADIVVMDVSFISQTLILPSIISLIRDSGIFVSLVKPQFEAGKGALGKNGIVKKAEDKLVAIERVAKSAIEVGLRPIGIITSPISGGDGNEEFLIYFRKENIEESILPEFWREVKNAVKNQPKGGV